MTVASGSLSLAIVGLETILAASSNFRARADVSDSDAAKRRIYFSTQRPVTPHRRPCAILALGGGALIQIGQGAEIYLGNTGQIVMILIDNTRFRHDDKSAYVDFLNFAGGVLDDINNLSGQDYDDGGGAGSAVYWSFTDAETLLEPTRTDVDLSAAEDYQLAAWGFGYGVD